MDWDSRYYTCSRSELLPFIKKNAEKVLDVGCGEGFFGKNLKQGFLARQVVGIEIVPSVAEKAELLLDKVICDNVETMDLGSLKKQYGHFDYIVCGDVLEHLKDPWQVLKSLTDLLKLDGHIIASIPNVRYWRIIAALLLEGKWEYASHGILDIAHLRFFTRKTAIRLFEQSGLIVESCEGAPIRSRLDKLFWTLTAGIYRDLLAVQWIVVGRRRTG